MQNGRGVDDEQAIAIRVHPQMEAVGDFVRFGRLIMQGSGGERFSGFEKVEYAHGNSFFEMQNDECGMMNIFKNLCV